MIPLPLKDDIRAQPDTLRQLVTYYQQHWDALAAGLPSAPPTGMTTLAGMGASLNAASIAALHLQTYRRAAFALEATDLLNYSHGLLTADRPLVFVSQSGGSGEIAPLLDTLPADYPLIGVTNNPESVLARRAQHVLPLLAGAEGGVATKTYVNTQAALWLLCRYWGGAWDGTEFDTLRQLADLIQDRIDHDSSARWLEVFDALDSARTLIFVGHGPHAWTARQTAMMVGEWAKVPALHASVGGLRHGTIESVQKGVGVIVFAAPDATQPSALKLARELDSYGATVLLSVAGQPVSVQHTPPHVPPIHDFLVPVLDTIAAQCFIDALAQHLGIAPGFRYIQKVVTAL